MGTERDFVVKKGLKVAEDIELGHATDTTIARASAGDVNIEGNIIYRAGGTDVPVTDGGTGSSSASGARTNLGVGPTAGNTSLVTTGTITTGTWQATDIAVAHGGTGASTLLDGGILLGNGTGAIQAMAVLGDGQMIVGDGTTDPVAESGATLRTSIGVGTGDTVQFTGINLGHATDTTIARASAGVITVEGTAVVLAGGANHDGFSDFVANEHIDHTSVTLTAGDGLSGGGTIAANRTFAVEAAQTTITSIHATDLIIGEDAQTAIDFGTADEIDFKAANAVQLTLADGVFRPEVNSDVDLGTSSLFFKDAFIDKIQTTGVIELGHATDTTIARSSAGVVTIEGETVVTIGKANSVTEPMIKATNAAGANEDNYLLSYDHATTGFTWVEASSGGASDIGALDDVLMDATNFVDGFLLQPSSDGSAPTTGTLSTATGNVGIGHDVFKDLTEGDYNVSFGYGTSENVTTGYQNVHIGYQAGQAMNTGAKNVFIGSQAGYSDPNGILGVAIGYRACFTGGLNYGVAVGGEANYSAGSNVTAVGYRAHKSHTGTFNVAIGREALDASGSGGYNVAIGGRHALGALTSGARNIGIGYQAGDGATTESDNIAIGYDALGGAVAGGEFNVAIGNYAGDALTSADNSVIIGHNAGSAVTTGSENIMVGFQAGFGISTGESNVFIGQSTGLSGGSAETGNVGIGHLAMSSIANADYNVGVGYKSGRYVKGQYNVYLGFESGVAVSNTGTKNIGVGYQAGNNITSGSNNVVIGAADVPSATGDDQLSISSGDGGVTWITGNSSGGINSKAEVVAVSGNTTLTLAQTGAYIYWTAGTLTLPASGTVGTQYTVINNTGGSATVAVNASNCSLIAGFSGATNATTAIADHELASFVCVTANNWIQVG